MPRLLAIAVTLWALHSAAADALPQGFSQGSLSGKIPKRASSQMPQSRPNDLLEPVSLTFVVSVCLADLEYDRACREISLVEAAKRLGQIYLDVYAMHRVAGSLRIWFPPHVEETEQRRFLREVEDRAIAAMVKNLENGTNQSAAVQTSSPAADSEDASALQTAQTARKWREDAILEARNGTNWLNDWPARTHLYRTGQALHELAVMDFGNH